ncbi:MAG: hypothetical protein HY927_01395 [Elusimicrobia bacterium]|nr:hypothetical protein [Elusimicrobiota bacterium]
MSSGPPAPPRPSAFPRRDFLIALGVYCLLMAWTHRSLILNRQVNSFTTVLPAQERIRGGIYEMVHQEPPAHWTAARIVRSGTFPSWTPYPHGGTPLIAKMQNGVFSPFHLHYYLVPDRWMPLAFTLVPIITGLFGYCLVYLYGRLLRLELAPAILAAVCYTYFTAFQGHALFSPIGTGLFLPLLLALAELYLQGHRPFALVMLPWACALPFFVGHMESAARIQAGAFAYLVFRILQTPGLPGRERAGLAVRFFAAAAVGDLAALCQVVPGMEYHKWSYNQVWRNKPEYGWVYHTIQKHLASADLPLLAIGLLCLYGAYRAYRAAVSKEPASASQLGRTLAAAASLGLGVAALWAVGLDDTILGWCVNPKAWLAQAFLLFFSVWLFLRPEPALPAAHKALGLLFLGSLAVELKLPGLSHLMAALPMVGSFNNTVYTPDFDLSRCILAAYALQGLAGGSLPDAWRERLSRAWPAVLLAVIGCLGYAASRPLKALVVGHAGFAARGSERFADAGFLGPEQLTAFPGKYPVAGSLPPGAPIEGVDILHVVGDRAKSAMPAFWDAMIDGRRRFAAEFPLEKGEVNLYAKVRFTGGERILPGPRIIVLQKPGPVFFIGLALLPLLLAGPRWLRYAALAAAAMMFVSTQDPMGIPAKEFPFRLPGVEKIKEDASLFRVDSTTYDFLQADYPNLYGLHDIRNGGDNMDVLSMLYFLYLRQGLMSQPKDPALALGLQLEGLANVKYIFDAPSTKLPSSAAEEFYRGPDMAVYRNKRFLPRAVFFEDSLHLPFPRPLDFDAGRRFALSELPAAITRPGFDPGKTLVLHDQPEPAPAAPAPSGPLGPPGTGEKRTSAPAPSPAARPEARMESYAPDRVRVAVDTPRPGFVFLSDNYFPGWSAFLNGRKTRILRSWLTFRAVAVPAGRSTVEFRYEPGWLVPLFSLTCLLALGWLAVYLRRSAASDWLAAAGPLPPPTPLPGATPAQPAALSSREKKRLKKLQPAAAPLVAQEPALPEGYPCLIEAATLSLALPCVLYWTVWSGFVYQGGIAEALRRGGESLPVNAAACAALAAMLAGGAWACRRRFFAAEPPPSA